MKIVSTLIAVSILTSCSFSGSVGNFYPFSNPPENSFCACENGSDTYGPKGEKCWEIAEERVGKQGYYGELEISKRPAYYSKSCRNTP